MNNTPTALPIQVAIVAENASTEFGGESFLPFQIFTHLKKKKIQATLIVHARCRENLRNNLSDEDFRSVIFVEDTWLQRLVNKIGNKLPFKFRTFITGSIISASTAIRTKKILRHLIHNKQINLIHQPTPVSPRAPSRYYSLHVPVIIGPMNGNMFYPPSFQDRQPKLDKILMQYGKCMSPLMHWMSPGKLKAQRLLVANERTAAALPNAVQAHKIMIIPENGVTGDFQRKQTPSNITPRHIVRFIFVGSLEPYKAVDVALEAFSRVSNQIPCELTIAGRGKKEEKLKELAKQLNIAEKVRFTGHLSHEELVSHLSDADAFIFPSLIDCGGAVVLEAMALELPIIASKWGGPIDYVDDSCGFLIEPTSHEDFVSGFCSAMITLGKDPELRKAMGRCGRQRVQQHYTWESKVKQFLDIYREVLKNDRC